MSFQPRNFYKFDDFTLDVSQRVLLRDGHREPLPPKAFDLLLTLVQRRGEIVDKETVMKEVWPDTFVEEANLGYNVHVLRRTLGAKTGSRSEYIETVPKRGYRFVPSVTEAREDDTDRSNGGPKPVEAGDVHKDDRPRLLPRLRWQYLLIAPLLIINAVLFCFWYFKLQRPVVTNTPPPEKAEPATEPAIVPDIAGTRTQPVPPPLPISGSSLERDAKGIAAMLVKEQFKEIAERFDQELRGIVTPEELRHEWTTLKPQLGSFQRISAISSSKRGKQQIVDLKCEFDGGPRVLRVMFTPAGDINGLWILPPGYRTASEDIKKMARGVFAMLLKEDFAGLTDRFDDSMRSTLPPEHIREVWLSTVTPLGPFERIVQVRPQEPDVIDVKAKFQTGFLYVRAGFDAKNRIRALWIQSSPK